MTADASCLRCRYDLRGVADDAACPECGLQAARSRRPTDALRDARPGWLRSLTVGAWMVLLAIFVAVVWTFASEFVVSAVASWLYYEQLVPPPWSAWADVAFAFVGASGGLLATLLLFAGAWLLTRREGYPPADDADRRRRWAIRSMAAIPFVTIAGLCTWAVIDDDVWRPDEPDLMLWTLVVAMLMCAPLPVLGATQLRSLARRVGSRHLAEHCSIAGWCASATVVVVVGGTLLFEHTEALGLSDDWQDRSIVALLILLAIATASAGSAVWFVYVLGQLAILFGRESRAMRRAWRDADRAAVARA